MCEQHKRPSHRLRLLRVGVPWHDHAFALHGLFDQNQPEAGNFSTELVQRLATPEAEIRGDLVVAGSARVQLAREISDLLEQESFDEGVHVLVLRAPRGTVSHSPVNAVQAVSEFTSFRFGEDAGPGQSEYPRLAGSDVVRPQANVNREAVIQQPHSVGGAGREPPAPHLVTVHDG
jgi:hypothetical protein